MHPGKTRNPWNCAHTPGGSSQGSAAAVAAGQVPAALGTQTNGSVIRPAAYCGVVGFKPTLGAIPFDGASLFSETFDTIGTFTRSVADAARLAAALADAGRDPAVPAAPRAAAPRVPAVVPVDAGRGRPRETRSTPPRRACAPPAPTSSPSRCPTRSTGRGGASHDHARRGGAQSRRAARAGRGAALGHAARCAGRRRPDRADDYRRAQRVAPRDDRDRDGLAVALRRAGRAVGARRRAGGPVHDRAIRPAARWPRCSVHPRSRCRVGRDARGMPLGLQLVASPGRRRARCSPSPRGARRGCRSRALLSTAAVRRPLIGR